LSLFNSYSPNNLYNFYKMSKIEISEFEWYFRDFLFKNHSKGIMQLVAETIPNNMIQTYLRYRNSDPAYISSILEIVLENLISSKFIVRSDRFVGLREGVARLQCNKCYYICYLGNLEPKNCLRCKSNELGTFPKKRSP